MNKNIKTNTTSRFGRIHLAMIRMIVAFALGADIAITNSIKAFGLLIARVKDNLATIDALEALIALPTTGITAQKNAMRKVLEGMTYSIMSATRTYAINTKKDDLNNQMTTTLGDLQKMNEQEFIHVVTNAIAIVTPITVALVDYAVDAALIGSWTDTSNTYRLMVTNPKMAIQNRKKINNQIQQMFIQTLNLLNTQCDKMVWRLNDTHAPYVKQWFSTRALNPNGRVVTKLRAIVQNELNDPIEGARVMVLDMDVPFTTNASGECTIEPVPFGNHQVVIISGMINKTFGPYRFKKGQSHTIYFTMTPTFVSPEQAPGMVGKKEAVK